MVRENENELGCARIKHDVPDIAVGGVISEDSFIADFDSLP